MMPRNSRSTRRSSPLRGVERKLQNHKAAKIRVKTPRIHRRTARDARLLSVREWYRLCPAGWEDAETPAFLARTTEIRKNCQNPLRFLNISCIMPVG